MYNFIYYTAMIMAYTVVHIVVYLSILSITVITKWLYHHIIRQFEMEKLEEEWKLVGTLQDIIIYPLDGGRGHHLSTGICRRSGIKSHNTLLNDRSYIAYSLTNKTAVLHEERPEMATINIDPLLTRLQRAPLLNPPLRKQDTIEYLGNPILVVPQSHGLANYARRFLNAVAEEIYICLFPPAQRAKLSKQNTAEFRYITNEIVDNPPPSYSPYTLINSDSLDELRFETGREIPSDIFRPNLVIRMIQDKPVFQPYCEDHFVAVKIGKVEFSNITPCIHSTTIINQLESSNQTNISSGSILPETMQTYLNTHCPEISEFNVPLFGINMKLKLKTKARRSLLRTITVGDPIFVKFKEGAQLKVNANFGYAI